MAIAVTPIWNHLRQEIIEPGSEIDMPSEMVQSLLSIGAAKESPAETLEPIEPAEPKKPRKARTETEAGE